MTAIEEAREQGRDALVGLAETIATLGRPKTNDEHALEVAVCALLDATEPPAPINGNWVCGKCAREVIQGRDDGQIPEHHRTCPKRDKPAEDERPCSLPSNAHRCIGCASDCAVVTLPDTEQEALARLLRRSNYTDPMQRAQRIIAAGYSKGPRPITDEMVVAALASWRSEWNTDDAEAMRAALGAVEEARR